MTKMELRAGIFEKLNSLLDDEESLQQLDNFLYKLKKKSVHAQKRNIPPPYTMEELNARIDRSEMEIDTGKTLTNENVFKEMENKYPWLCK